MHAELMRAHVQPHVTAPQWCTYITCGRVFAVYVEPLPADAEPPSAMLVKQSSINRHSYVEIESQQSDHLQPARRRFTTGARQATEAVPCPKNVVSSRYRRNNVLQRCHAACRWLSTATRCSRNHLLPADAVNSTWIPCSSIVSYAQVPEELLQRRGRGGGPALCLLFSVAVNRGRRGGIAPLRHGLCSQLPTAATLRTRGSRYGRRRGFTLRVS